MIICMYDHHSCSVICTCGSADWVAVGLISPLQCWQRSG